MQDIQGKHDPLYADVPSIFSQNRRVLQAPTGSAAMLGASDDQMTDVIKKVLAIVTFRHSRTPTAMISFATRETMASRRLAM